MTMLRQHQEFVVRLVHAGREQQFRAAELGVENPLDNEQVLTALRRRLDIQLDGYTISRHNQNVLVSPAPVFG